MKTESLISLASLFISVCALIIAVSFALFVPDRVFECPTDEVVIDQDADLEYTTQKIDSL